MRAEIRAPYGSEQMRYYYTDSAQGQIGPYTLEELRQLHLSGVVRAETAVLEEGKPTTIIFKDLWAQMRERTPSGPTSAATSTTFTPPLVESFTRQASEDLRLLLPHLLMPLQEFKSFNWVQNRKLLFIAGIGLLPLVILAMFSDHGDFKSAYWALAFYFSALWGMFFYYVFPAPGVRLATTLLAFFGTGVVSISVLLLAYKVPPLSSLFDLTQSNSTLMRLLGYWLAVGVPEELCKALVVIFIARTQPGVAPQLLLFYGLMSGLGFGIYEGVDYQMGRNFKFSRFVEQYYLLNVIRLTTLPFLHAIWTGIAAYFIGFAQECPQRRRGLYIVAMGIPAFMHGCYNTFNGSVVGLSFALISVFALCVYLAKSVDFGQALKASNGVTPNC